jgi:hypothetical protein
LSFFCKRTTMKQQQQVISIRVRAAASYSNGEEGVRLTVSDSELASRGFAVRCTTEGLDVGALNEVFSRVGFPRRQEERRASASRWTTAGGVAVVVLNLNDDDGGGPSGGVRSRCRRRHVQRGGVGRGCWDRPSALAGIDRRLLLGSTVSSCWYRPSALRSARTLNLTQQTEEEEEDEQ